MAILRIYTDGGCSGNQEKENFGGWGAILEYGEHQKELFGGQANTTNNRMELTAAIRGLGALKEPCEVLLSSDSRYLTDAIRLGWLEGWRAHGWKRGKEPLKNPDLWQELYRLLSLHHVTVEWVKGHNGHPYNERCDALASAEAAALSSPADDQT